MRRFRPEEFDALVEQAVEGLPEKFRRHLENVAIDVEERPTLDLLASLGMARGEPLFGAFQGPTEGEAQGFFELPSLPPRITIFQRPIEKECTSRAEAIREIQLTVLHEVGHYFGLDEDQLTQWEEEIYEAGEGEALAREPGES